MSSGGGTLSVSRSKPTIIKTQFVYLRVYRPLNSFHRIVSLKAQMRTCIHSMWLQKSNVEHWKRPGEHIYTSHYYIAVYGEWKVSLVMETRSCNTIKKVDLCLHTVQEMRQLLPQKQTSTWDGVISRRNAPGGFESRL